jgi:hypothetical protein
VQWKAIWWGAALGATGLVVAFGMVPGSNAWAAGPRYGISALLLTTAAFLFCIPTFGWIGRRTARVEGNGGANCPVGATCACGHFNFKPRATCRACGQPTAFST